MKSSSHGKHAAPRHGGYRGAALACLACVAVIAAGGPASAAGSATRLAQALDHATLSALPGNVSPLARAAYDRGRADADQVIHGVSLHFKLSDTQQQDLDQLLRQQQDPASSSYHAWLSPAQYRSRFGMSQEDLTTVQNWLRTQGFSIEDIAPNANRISFSGSVAQIEAAFHTEMHRYRVAGASRIANAGAPALPAALSAVTLGLRNLSEFRPRARALRLAEKARAATAHFTSSISGNHYLAPDDFATIYDLQSLYSAGITGAGQKIAILGQSAVQSADLSAFRSAAGLGANLPTMVLVPHSGSATVQAASGDEAESDLDLQWSGAIARDASISFVYTGSSTNYGVFDSLVYAVENDTAPIISLSYGDCEPDYSSADIATLESTLKQASAQGQTVIVASGDSGAADCDYSTDSETVTAASHGLAVDYPASSAYATAVGGTTLSEGSGSYWSGSNDRYNGSAQSYIPETAWNDTSDSVGLEASGGGKSVLFAKPSWQSGSGVPADGVRDLPDIALAASPNHDGYLYCSEGSCSNGFRDSGNYLTVAGGTSFGAPAFAAILALLSQKNGGGALGNINSRLYALAASSTSVFHDITSGDNKVPCSSGSTGCGSAGTIGYNAAAGYDLVTGLGSIDGFNLADQWVASSPSSSSSSSSGSSSSSSSSSSGSSSSSSSGSSGSSSSSSSSGAASNGGSGGAFDPLLLAAFALLLHRRRNHPGK
ncbi:S53 family peptidase [Nevskia soli]|uniref:S53 family peptidase n=1 Tax=Nevskia soli TaxID=418856 RepID=UPI00068EFC46|nr:S53 family peptidase [Nevskia soli]